ncbi:hypothetical protein C4J81_07640 [Deltaproteobacteria bacterium Smac51]|nr:hypothetical protein C4J81_07640 [Deltaproteobacteria bacterium Smac51]
MPSDAVLQQEGMLINEINLVLAEKRTSLSVMRTGIAVLALPISVLSVLVAISKFYEPSDVMYFLAPLLSLCGVLTVLGAFMIWRALRRIAQLNKVVSSLKKQNTNLRDLCLVMGDLVKPDADF